MDDGWSAADGIGAEIDELLLTYRRRAGLTQEQLSELSGVSYQTISNVERGLGHRPRPETVRRLADGLRLDAGARAAFEEAGRRWPKLRPGQYGRLSGGGEGSRGATGNPRIDDNEASSDQTRRRAGLGKACRVFLCHASDDKAAVQILHSVLVRAGVQPWLDEFDLLPGQDWEREITRAVRASDVVVVCLSNASIVKRGFVQKEIRFALDVAEELPEGEIFIIPLRLEPCTVPDRLCRWQWVDYFEEHGLDRLLRALKQRSSGIS